MNRPLVALHHQRGQLVERLAHQRATLARQLAPVRAASESLDRATQAAKSGAQYLKEHPLPVLLGVATLVALKPRRVWRLMSRSLVLWRTWRAVRPWVPQSLLRKAFNRYF